MEALGEKLRNAREEKGYTFEQASLETNIAARYLEALEAEEFDKFPGEAYLLGFLRNYGKFLGLDAEELFAGYRAHKLQEQPVPVEQLLRSRSSLPRIFRNVAIIVGIAVLGGVAVYLFQNRQEGAPPAPPRTRSPVSWTMEDPFLERRFYLGDSIIIPLDSVPYKIEVAGLGDAVSLDTPLGRKILDLSQELNVELTRDGAGSVLVTAVDFSKADPAAGVLLRLDLEYRPAAAQTPAPAPAEPVPLPPATAASAPVIFTSPTPYPFTVQVNFQGFCMFRWEILFERDRKDRNERYFSRSDGELNIQAQNGVRIWLSNAQAARIQVIGGGGRTVPLEIGGAGEVVVADLRWVRDEDGRFRLILLRLE